MLTEEGLSRVDGRIAELATLGRAARSGQRDGELGVLAYYVGTDLLIVTETVPGLVRDDWGPQLDQAMKLWGETPELVALARAASRRVELRTAAEDRASSERNRRTQEDLALTGERATLSQELHEAVVALSRVPHGYGPRAAGLKAQLTKLREDAAVTRSRSSLAAIREAAGRVLFAVDELEAQISRRQAEMAQAARARKEADLQARQFEKTQKAADRAAEQVVRARRAEIRAELKPWRSLWTRLRKRSSAKPNEDVPAALIHAGVVAPEREAYLENQEPLAIEKWWAQRRGRPEPHVRPLERVRTVLVDRAGHRYSRRELNA